MSTLGKAIAIASELFKDTKDKGGNPYILHCLYVMGDTEDEVEAICGVLHDVVEDTEWTLQDLRDEGFNEEVIEILDLLWHRPEVSYDDYIKRLAHKPKAKRIKKRDLRHNSDITRIKGLRKKDIDRIEQYHRAYIYLSD